MDTWLVAIVDGAIGSVITALIAFGASFIRARGEVSYEAVVRCDRDEDL